MNWGFLAICVMLAARTTFAGANNGKPRDGKYHIGMTLWVHSVDMVLVLWAMHWRIN